MEEIFSVNKIFILEEILFAISTVSNEDDDVIKYFQSCFQTYFDVTQKEFEEAKENASQNFEYPKICVNVKSIKFRNLQYITDVSQGVRCLIRIGEKEFETQEGNTNYEWNIDQNFFIKDFAKDEIDISIWQEQEESKGNFGRVWLRSLDQWSKKIRSTLRSQNLSNLPLSVLSDTKKTFLEPDSPIVVVETCPTSANDEIPQHIEPEPLTKFKEKEKKRDSIPFPETSWIVNPFASLRRSGAKKVNQDGGGKHSSSKARFLDIRSPIPTGQELGRDRNWRVKSEKSFFSKYDNTQRGRMRGNRRQLNKEECNNEKEGDIRAKAEVSVKRQLFRQEPSAAIPEDGINTNGDIDATQFSGDKLSGEKFSGEKLSVVPLTNKNVARVKRLMPTSCSMSDFSTINLSDDATNTPSYQTKDDSKLESRTKQNFSKYGSLRSSGKNDFQLWKRMSLSLREKTFLNEVDSKENKVDIQERLLPFKNADGSILREERETETTKVKMKIGSASIKLRKLFSKMNCSKGTVDEEITVSPATSRKESCSPLKPPTLFLSLQVTCEDTMLPAPPLKVFVLCLKQLLNLDKMAEVQDRDDLGLFLPLASKSKTILKSLIFVYNIPEAQISLACWCTLTHGQTPAPFLAGVKDGIPWGGNKTEELSKVEKENCRRIRLIGVSGNIHPKFIFHWLTKIEGAASCSSYSMEEEQEISSSITTFIETLCQQLKKIHAAFPVNHSSHLAYGLRCVHLLSESESLQNIVRKWNDFGEESSWPKTEILKAVYVHAKNWTEALDTEIRSSQRENLLRQATGSEGGAGPAEGPGPTGVNACSPVPVSSISLMQAILDGEKAMLAVNDFLLLGHKVYETNFNSELDESYLQIVWPKIASVLVTVLDPIRAILRSNGSKAILKTGVESIGSLWNLLIRMSKLQRFQNSKDKEVFSLPQPDVFSETFFLLCQLWLDNCLMEARSLELKLDLLDYEDGLCSTARELVDLINVIQEKLKRISFPSDKHLKENLAKFLDEGVRSLVDGFQLHLCRVVLDKCLEINTLTPEICVAANSVDVVCVEASKLTSLLSPQREKTVEPLVALREPTRDACFFLITKSLPRISVWIQNGLGGSEKENSPECILDWIQSALEPVLNFQHNKILLRHFWDFVFSIVKEKLKFLVQPEDFRVMGSFMENIYFLYKITLRVELHSESQIEFQQFMETIELKGSATSQVIQMYFTERFKEQEQLVSGRQPLVLNAYFCKDKGLKVEVFVAPFVDVAKEKFCFSASKESGGSTGTRRRMAGNPFTKTFLAKTHMRQKASEVIEALAKSSAVNFYIKATPVPEEWFRKVKSKKTKSTARNPPVFDEVLTFNIKNTDEGVVRGGFLLLRLKYSLITSSGVESEAFLPLKDIPLLSPEEQKSNKYNALKLSTPSKIQDYTSLRELDSRKQDKEATSFISHLAQSF